MDEGAAVFAFQVEMLPAMFFAVYILITGAFPVMRDIFANHAIGGKFFKMPVYRGLPHDVFRVRKMARHLIHRYMIASQGLHIVEYGPALPGMIICRTFTRHICMLSRTIDSVNMKMNIIFNLSVIFWGKVFPLSINAGDD
jgi:hypothetical protein